MYSSTTPIPYTLTGYLNDVAVFTIADRLPDTFGAFRTVTSPRPDDLIDTLIVSLSHTTASCCGNAMASTILWWRAD